jgi:hypothetical protein
MHYWVDFQTRRQRRLDLMRRVKMQPLAGELPIQHGEHARRRKDPSVEEEKVRDPLSTRPPVFSKRLRDGAGYASRSDQMSAALKTLQLSWLVNSARPTRRRHRSEVRDVIVQWRVGSQCGSRSSRAAVLFGDAT